MQLTVKGLRQRPKATDLWLSDGAVRGAGALWARLGTSGGVSFYFRYTDAENRKKAVALGGYDEEGVKGLSLLEARDKAKVLSKLYQGGERDLHGHLERERQAAERSRKAAEDAAAAASADAKRGTLQQLLDAYIVHLARAGKQSERDVRSIFEKHVTKAAPELVTRKASHLGVDDLVGLVGNLMAAGKGRTGNKLRSYLRAAFQLALEAKTNPSAGQDLRSFGITLNPIASIGTAPEHNRARHRTLSAPELGAFLRKLDALPEGAQRDALQLVLQLGGQRPVQLLRVTPADIDLDAGTVTLRDGKGARSQPRLHVLPLVKNAAKIFAHRIAAAGDGPLFSTDKKTNMRIETISVVASEISEAMQKKKESREAFQLRDVRRTCETMLASLGVSSDIRAQLQSHGLGGVQNRHYDRYDYAIEKRAALEKWNRHLESLKAGKTADVVSLEEKKRGKT